MKWNRVTAGQIIGEFLATFMYCLMGCLGCALVADADSFRDILDDVQTEAIKIVNLQVYNKSALGWALALAAAMQCFLPISGAHINPAVTIAAMILEACDVVRGIMYLLMQFLGAFLGVGLARLLADKALNKTSLCLVIPLVKVGFAAGIELVLSLIWVFAMCSHFKGEDAELFESLPARMGVVLWALHFAGALTTGPGLHPFRALAANVVHANFTDCWVYIVLPLISGALGGVIWRFIMTKAEPPKREADD